jgi:hypothetical protein
MWHLGGWGATGRAWPASDCHTTTSIDMKAIVVGILPQERIRERMLAELLSDENRSLPQ